MKVGAELEYYQPNSSHNRSGKAITEYYEDTWERNDFLKTLSRHTARDLKEFVIDVMKYAGDGAVFGSSYCITSRETEEDSTYVWNGLHLHISCDDLSLPISTVCKALKRYVMKSLQSDLSLRQKMSHHIWGGECPDDFKHAYQRSSHFRPVAWRPSLCTFEIRLLDLHQIIETPVNTLTQFFMGLNDILKTGETKREVRLAPSGAQQDVHYKVMGAYITRGSACHASRHFNECAVHQIVIMPREYIKLGSFKEIGNETISKLSSRIRNIEERAESSGHANQSLLSRRRALGPSF